MVYPSDIIFYKKNVINLKIFKVEYNDIYLNHDCPVKNKYEKKKSNSSKVKFNLSQ